MSGNSRVCGVTNGQLPSPQFAVAIQLIVDATDDLDVTDSVVEQPIRRFLIGQGSPGITVTNRATV
jgi:hypothetical protein